MKIGRKVGMSLSKSIGMSAGKKAGLGLIAAAGIASGLKSQDTSGHLYDMLFDNPNMDNDIFGTDVGFRELVAPFPGPFTRLRAMGGEMGRVPALMTAQREGFLNGTLYNDFWRNRKYYNNEPPRVDGSLVFGQYNARNGA